MRRCQVSSAMKYKAALPLPKRSHLQTIHLARRVVTTDCCQVGGVESEFVSAMYASKISWYNFVGYAYRNAYSNAQTHDLREMELLMSTKRM
jgi:hypothetical protein